MKVLAVDQSYARCGFAVSEDGVLKECFSVGLGVCRNKTAKRRVIAKVVNELVSAYGPDYVMLERVRMFSKGFVSVSVIQSMGALISVIIDACYPLDVFSADTRSWKSKVLGSSRLDKSASTDFVRSLGFDISDDDAGDAGCIALYPFAKGSMLKGEK